MGYNACYGLQCNDCMTEYELETKHNETESFLCLDNSGMLVEKTEHAMCDTCGAKLVGESMVYVHGNKKLCRKCELQQRMAERKKQLKNRNKKAV